MKKYSTLLVVVITILLMLLLTWILPITYLNGGFVEAERSQMGLMNLLSYPEYTFYNFIYVFLYLIGIGGIYGLLNKTGAYRVMLDRIVEHVKGREVICLILTTLIISLVVSFTGFTFEALLILPFIASVILLLGYDKITALMVTIGSISIGIIGTTYSKLVAGGFNQMLGTNYSDLVIVKAVLLIVCVGILILNVILHARKVEKNRNVLEGFLIPEAVKERKVKVWPLATMLIVFLLIIVLGTIDWTGAFNINFFNDIHTKVLSYHVLSKYVVLTFSLLVVLCNVVLFVYKRRKSVKKDEKFMGKVRLIITIVFGVFAFLAFLKIMLEDVFNATDIMNRALNKVGLLSFVEMFTFGKLFGMLQPLGSWTYNDYFALMIFLGLMIKVVYHIKFENALDSINSGFKNTLYGAIVCMLAYTVLIIISSHPIVLTILKPILSLSDSLHILWYPLCTFISALCNTDFTYYQYGALNLSYAAYYFQDASVYPLVGLITQSMYGFALFLAPTSTVLLFSLSLLEVRYTTWLKKMWLPLLEILLAIFVTYIVVLQFLI